MSTFDPRRAEPGQEFSYTTSETTDVAKGEDGPEGAVLVSVDQETGDQVYRRDGVERTLKADKSGVVRPKTQADVAVLDGFGLPVHRAAKKEAAEEADAKAAAKADDAKAADAHDEPGKPAEASDTKEG